ncbi:response regulator [Sphingomonas sp. RHCKR47]|nr:response regulator [Sphingomonas citricola]
MINEKSRDAITALASQARGSATGTAQIDDAHDPRDASHPSLTAVDELSLLPSQHVEITRRIDMIEREAGRFKSAAGAGLVDDARRDRLIDQLVRLARAADARRAEAASREDAAVANLGWAAVLAIVLAAVILAWSASRTYLYVARPLKTLARRAKKLADGGRGLEFPEAQRSDVIGELGRSLARLRQVSDDNGDALTLKSTLSDLMIAVQRETTLPAFAAAFLQHLAPRVNAGVATFYVRDDAGVLTMVGSYGYRNRRHDATSYAPGEGLVGQCAIEGKPIILSPVPDTYVCVHSGTDEACPDAVMIAPVRVLDRTIGVIELAGFGAFSALSQQIIEEAGATCGLPLDNLQRTLGAARMLDTERQQLEDIRAAEEELRAQQEELRATNEELELQTQRLAASEEELRAQTEDLLHANEQLHQRSEQLVQRSAELEVSERATQARAEELERANMYKSQFLANMSHELRTPLNSMLILAQDLAENTAGHLDAGEVEAAGVIHSSGTNLLRLINDILDLAKVEAGKSEVSEERFLIAEFRRRLEQVFRPIAQQKGLTLRFEVDPRLPTAVIADEGKLEQIATNLVGNALKFTPHGSVDVAFGNADGRPDLLVIAVRDSGIGIAADKLDTVFQAFEQADASTRRQFGGTGLGLAISRELAQTMGGTIDVVSVEGRGTTFTPTIPVKADATPRASAADAGTRVPTTPAAAAAIDDDRTSDGSTAAFVLAIDDDPTILRSLVKIIRRCGYRALAAADGEAGFALALAHRPAGILLDLMLPGTDGWGVLDRLKQHDATKGIPVHLISAADESADRAVAAGAQGLLCKPVDDDALAFAVRSLVTRDDARSMGVLLVEDDEGSRLAVSRLLARNGVQAIAVGSGEEALARIADPQIDCMVLDLGLPGISGLEVLREIRARNAQLPIVIYSARDLSTEEQAVLDEGADAVVLKGERSHERLFDEVWLFLNRLKMRPGRADAAGDDLRGRRVLVVDDDMRNTYALAKVLRAKGLEVQIAQDGARAIAMLEDHAPGKRAEVVLMDIMMPGMDGYEATARVRELGGDLARLPIIALTAKAMADDRDKCLQAGANDYMTKPVDVPRLLSLLRVWLSK